MASSNEGIPNKYESSTVTDEAVPTVEISYDQLNADKPSSNNNGSKHIKKKVKRPDVAIYQPGARFGSRLKSSNLDGQNDKSKEEESAATDLSATDLTVADKGGQTKTKTKRPEIQVYTPKKLQLSSSSANNTTESIKDKDGNKPSIAEVDSPSHDTSVQGNNNNNSMKTSSKKKNNVVREWTRSTPEKQSDDSSKENPALKPSANKPTSHNKNNRDRQRDGKSQNRDRQRDGKSQKRDQQQDGKSQNRDRQQNSRSQEKTTTTENDKERVEQAEKSVAEDTITSNDKTQSKRPITTQKKSVSFSSESSIDHEISLTDLQDSMEALTEMNPRTNSDMTAEDSTSDNTHISSKNNRQKHAQKVSNNQRTNTSSSSSSRKSNSAKSQSRRSKNTESDSRLYDPYAENKKKSEGEGQIRGLIKLPDSQANRNSPSPTSVRGGGALYNPEDPSKPIRVQSESTDYRSMGSGDYFSPPPSLMYPPEAYRNNIASGVMPPVMPPAAYFGGSSYNNYVEDDGLYQREETSKHKVSLLIRDVVPLDRQLQVLVSKRLESEALDHVHRLRVTVRDKLEQIILLDLQYSVNHNVDQLLWKSVYHNILENMRSELQEEENTDIRTQISSLLDEADAFYEGFLSKLEKHNSFTLSDYTCPHRLQASTSRTLKFALLMSQRLLICLGDIARYRTQNESSSDYGKSRRYYLKASHVAPKNGKPYNQLAIIAMYAKRKLDTVFYFMRSIAASNAFLSAKESLRAIYNDIIKRYEHTRQQAERARLQRQTKLTNRQNTRHLAYYKRIEQWISPIDGSSITDHIDDEKDIDDPAKMPCNELYRKLMTTFLCCQGMIFSKVGMEHFPEASSEVLYQFRALLNHSPIPLVDINKLIQMFAICMFSIQHAGMQVNPASLETEKCRSYIQEQAVLLCLDMLTVVIKTCTTLLTSDSKVLTTHLMSHDLLLLLPIVRLVADWMTCHPHLWNPPPCPRDPVLGPVLDPWQTIAVFTNTLSQLSIHHIKFYSSDEVPNDLDRFSWLKCQEELDLKGFLPLMNLSVEEVFVKSDVNLDEAAQCFRVSKLITFGDYLCGVEPPMLDFDTQSAKYASLIEPPSLSEKSSQLNKSKCDSDEEESDSDSDKSVSEDEGVAGVDEEMFELKRKKKELRRQLAQQQKQQKAQQAIFDKEDHLIQLEIRPVFVVPDTNCFIEYLSDMQRLICSKKFTVVIPLVVINELDGLSRSPQADKYSDLQHGETVQDQAIKAIDFLECQFESRNNRLRALTMSGTELETITYRSEESTAVGTNDDKILSCCLHYCSDNARDFMPKHKDSTITLLREVVLLTDDRNLRLKAHTRNVPVKDLLQFLEWSKIK